MKQPPKKVTQAPAQASSPAQQPQPFGVPFPSGVQFQAGQLQVVQSNVLPPDILEKLNQLVPGSAERLIDLSCGETLTRRSNEGLALTANIEAQKRQISIAEYQSRAVFRSDLIGQIAGLAVCLVCVGGAIYVGTMGYWQTACALAAIPTAAVIRAFTLTGRPKPPAPAK